MTREDRTAIEVPAAWAALGAKPLAGTVLVIGAADRGKSTLVRWLVGQLLERRRRAAWLDGDIGQATLGVPATMSLAVLEGSPSERPTPVASFFVGATSPRGHMLPTLVGVARLRERALAAGATAVVVDTTGLVAAEAGGGALKEWKIELLRPQVVVAIQRDGELEHLLGPLRRERRMTLHILEPAAAVRARSPEGRAARRRRLFRDYFAEAAERRIALRGRPVYALEKAVPGRLLALNDVEGFVLALGLCLKRRSNVLEVLTPLADLRQVAALRIGDLRLDAQTGEEWTG